jgi:hypothetical protein
MSSRQLVIRERNCEADSGERTRPRVRLSGVLAGWKHYQGALVRSATLTSFDLSCAE